MAKKHSIPGKKLRRWQVPLFFIGWTLFAAGATWWLVHSSGLEHPSSELLFESKPDAQVPIGAQIRRWLTMADLSFRGAYPWVLLAPYVFWLTSRFVLERGRLRFSLPVHAAACAGFALASRTILTHSMEKRNLVIVVSERHTTNTLPELSSSNEAFNTLAGTNINDRISTRTYKSPLGEVQTKIVVTGGQEPPIVPMSLPGTGTGHGTNGSSVEDFLQRFGPGADPEAPPGALGARWLSSTRYDSRLFSGFLNLLAYGSLAGIAHAVHFYRRARERERRAVLLESHLAQARLHTLQAQLQPHFLFNALNAVATLLRRDAAAAQEALTSFSELLRLALSQSDKQEVTLREDLLFVERYIEIQQTRLGNRLRFEQSVDSSALDCLVPTLFLQPLVENAIRHGIELSSAPGLVRVVAQPNGDRLRFTIEDNGVGLGAEAQQHTTGIGLSNLRARMEALYGAAQKVEVISRAEGGVSVCLEIPLRHDSPNHAPSS